MHSNISDPRLAASLFVIQFVVVGSVALGAFIARYWDHRSVIYPFRADDSERARSGMTDVGILFVWLIATLAPLTFTAFSLSGWSTIGFNPPELSVRFTCAWALGLDLLFASWFIFRSGGWSDSPFTSVLVAVPTFAILLEEPVWRVLVFIAYVVVVSAVLLVLNATIDFSGTRNSRDRRRLNTANWVLSSSMLGLIAWIGMFGATR